MLYGDEVGFKWYDYLIFSSTLAVSLGIGVFFGFFGGKQKTTNEYLMGNRNMGVIPVGLSMFMSYISAILVLGNTAEMYTQGAYLWLSSVGSSLAFISSAVFFVPLFFPLHLTSAFEYLELRFRSRAVVITAVLLLMLSQILYMGIAIFSPATALDAATGIPVWASIVATGVVGTVYTTMGGMKAVIWTDVFQCGVMLAGLIAVLIVGTDKVGGIAKMWNICEDWGRLKLFKWDMDPTVRLSVWAIIIGRLVSSTQTVGTGQTSVQRYCSLKTKLKGQLSVLLNVPFMMLIYTITCLCGLVVFAFYTNVVGCDPLRAQFKDENDDYHSPITSSNQLLPYFIVRDMNIPVLPGLFVAVLFSGALSTVSSSLNSLSAVAWKNLLEWRYGHISEENKAIVTKVLAAAFGAIAIGMAFFSEILGGHVLQASQSFVSGTAGPSLGMFILGSFFPWSNWIGAVTGAWVGLGFAMVSTVGSYVINPHQAQLDTCVMNCSNYHDGNGNYYNLTKNITFEDPEGVFPLFRISYLWFAGLGTTTTIVVGLIVSILTGLEDPRRQDPRLITPVFDKFMCCLPPSIRKQLHCGVDYSNVTYNADGIAISWVHDGVRYYRHDCDGKINNKVEPHNFQNHMNEQLITKL